VVHNYIHGKLLVLIKGASIQLEATNPMLNPNEMQLSSSLLSPTIFMVMV
jgi:hypothetical protein